MDDFHLFNSHTCAFVTKTENFVTKLLIGWKEKVRVVTISANWIYSPKYRIPMFLSTAHAIYKRSCVHVLSVQWHILLCSSTRISFDVQYFRVVWLSVTIALQFVRWLAYWSFALCIDLACLLAVCVARFVRVRPIGARIFRETDAYRQTDRSIDTHRLLNRLGCCCFCLGYLNVFIACFGRVAQSHFLPASILIAGRPAKRWRCGVGRAPNTRGNARSIRWALSGPHRPTDREASR